VSRFCQMHLCHFSSSCTVVDVFSSTWGACSMIAGHLQTLYFDLAEKRALIFARASCEKARVANKKLSTHIAAGCRTGTDARMRLLRHAAQQSVPKRKRALPFRRLLSSKSTATRGRSFSAISTASARRSSQGQTCQRSRGW